MGAHFSREPSHGTGSRRPPRIPETLEWLLWLGSLALATAAMLPLRQSLDEAHVALAYLLLVLGASARSGRKLGLITAVAAFFSLNFFFVPPYHTFMVDDPLDW